MKRALVCGAGGFIAGHLALYLKAKGYYVVGVDIKKPEFRKLGLDRFLITDLRNEIEVSNLFKLDKFDEVYQLAADMGGMGFIHTHEIDCLTNNIKINMNMINQSAIHKVKRYFYSSSVCIYRDTKNDNHTLTENEAYPALPDNEYGWEKLYSERVALAYAKHNPIEVRIARFENCYGPFGTYQGGREKAPAALCRKVVTNDKEIEIWGTGEAKRSFVYVSDLVDGIYRLMQSDIKEPTNIGTEEIVTINQLADIICKVAGKKLDKKYVNGEVGVMGRNFSHEKIRSLGWRPKYSLEEGIKETYNWIKEQV